LCHKVKREPYVTFITFRARGARVPREGPAFRARGPRSARGARVPREGPAFRARGAELAAEGAGRRPGAVAGV